MLKTAFTGVEEAFSFLESFTNFEKRAFSLRNFRLDRMHRLLELFDFPQRGMRFFHVAGSKGKGSTAAFIASILRRQGLAAGLYTSPHLVSYKERITLAGDEIEDGVFLRNIERIRELLTGFDPGGFPGGEYPTTFELLTCLAFLIFRELGCPWAVLETGLGGRLDATNVVSPAAIILTPIELEHTEFLGKSLAAIAGEKAGIIKPRRPVFSSAQDPQVLGVFRRRAAEENSPFFYLPQEAEISRCPQDPRSNCFSIKWKNRRQTTGSSILGQISGGNNSPKARFPGQESLLKPPPAEDPLRIQLGLLGEVQGENAALAALAVREVLPEVSRKTLAQGLEEAFIPGRFQKLEDTPPLYVDGSHTPLSVERLLRTFLELHPHPETLILGLVKGKRYDEIARLLCPPFRSVIVTTPGTFKSSEPEKVLATCLRHNPRSRLIEDPIAALKAARQQSPGGPILITGSFYLAGEILKRYPNRKS